ncbi:MAG: hypothetical protein AB7N76_36070 [Planctomycetota bacterium]
MRAYVRNEQPWSVEREPLAPPRPRAEGFPVFWGTFAERLTEAMAEASPAERRAAESLVACGGREFTRVHRCGVESGALGAWCGHTLCPACAQLRAAEAARFAGERWDAQLLWVSLRAGPAAREGAPHAALPDATTVAGLRTAWSRATERAEELTGFPRLEVVPRAVIAPGEVQLFVRLPWEEAPEGRIGQVAAQTLETAARRACRELGLAGAQARVLSREAASWQLRAALLEESRRFQDAVGYDLARLAALRWRTPYPGDASVGAQRAAAARRWLETLGAAYAERRRPRLLGGKQALEAPPASEPRTRPEACPRHGGLCAVDETRVRRREDGALLQRAAGDQVPAAARAAIARYLGEVPGVPLVEEAAPLRLRLAA